MKFNISYTFAILMAPLFVSALPTAGPESLPNPILNVRDVPSAEVDLPAFITAIFDGLANVIAAAGGAAANTIAATGGAVANGLDPDGSIPAAVSNSTLAGRAKLDKVGREVAVELTDALSGRRRV